MDSMNTQSYQPQEPVPQVVIWYKVYCGALAFVYLLIFLLGLALLILPHMGFEGFKEAFSKDGSDIVILIYGVLFIVLGLVFMAAFFLGIIFPYRFWSWIYGIVLISIGFTSLCCMLASIPLLIFWINDKTRNFFRNAG